MARFGPPTVSAGTRPRSALAFLVVAVLLLATGAAAWVAWQTLPWSATAAAS